MKLRTTVIAVLLSLFSIRGVADGGCATWVCDLASEIEGLPVDVADFVSERDGCDHFRGEPVPEGSDFASKDRREFILDNISKLCSGTDEQLNKLINKYRQNHRVFEFLRNYEKQIEHVE